MSGILLVKIVPYSHALFNSIIKIVFKKSKIIKVKAKLVNRFNDEVAMISPSNTVLGYCVLSGIATPGKITLYGCAILFGGKIC